MKVIIAGSRHISPPIEEIQEAVDLSGFKVAEVVCGMADGVDWSGRAWAIAKGIPWVPFPALWDNFDPTIEPVYIKTNKYGKRYNAMAGRNRNGRMAVYGDALIAIWNGASTGTANMIRFIDDLKKPRYLQIRKD